MNVDVPQLRNLLVYQADKDQSNALQAVCKRALACTVLKIFRINEHERVGQIVVRYILGLKIKIMQKYVPNYISA